MKKFFNLKTRRILSFILMIALLFGEPVFNSLAADDDPVTVAPEEGDDPEAYAAWAAQYGVDTDLAPYEGEDMDLYGDALGYEGDNALTIFYFLVNEMGLHKAAAVGILANIFCESSFRYDAVGDNGTSYGICQWHAGRWTNLQTYCNNNGLDWRTLGGQLQFLKYETSTSFPNTMAAIRATSNNADGAWESARLWCKNFEVPADTINTSYKRGDIARDVFWPLYQKYEVGGSEEEGEPEATSTPTPRPVIREDVPEEVVEEIEEEVTIVSVNEVLEEDIPADGIIPDGIWVAGIEDKDYSGKSITQDFRVYDNTRLLKLKTDYTISYKNNKKAGGEASVTDGTTLAGDQVICLAESTTTASPEEGDAPGNSGYENEASTSENEASTSENEASSGENEASTSENEASSSENEASTSENEASSSENEAEEGENDETSSENEASSSENEAEEGGEDDEEEEKDTSDWPQLTLKFKGNYAGSLTIPFAITPLDIGNGDSADITLNYSGKKQQPKPVLTLNGTKLKYGRDYTVPAYEKDLANGWKGSASGITEVELLLCGQGNYCGEKAIILSYVGKKTASENAIPQVLMSMVNVSKIPTQTYSGEEFTITSLSENNLLTKKGKPLQFKLKYKGKTLSDNDVEVLSVENSLLPGKATVTLRGREATQSATGYSFVGIRRISFTIKGQSISKLKLKFTQKSYSYTGEAIEPEYILSGLKNFTENDYTVKYLNNVMPGKASLLISGCGNFTGTKTFTFKITAIPITGEGFELWDVSGNAVSENNPLIVEYESGGGFPEFSITWNGELLQAGVDYNVSYKNYKKARLCTASSAPTLVIKGCGRFNKTLKVKYTITPRSFKEHVHFFAGDKANTGAAGNFLQAPVISDVDGTVLKLGRDYKNLNYYVLEGDKIRLLYNDDKVRSGDVIYVSITGCGGYSKERIFTTYRVIPSKYALSKATITIADQGYTGNPIRITSADQIIKAELKGTPLVFGEDFRVVPGSYQNNIAAGYASVTFVGMDDYNGQKVVKFRITAKEP